MVKCEYCNKEYDNSQPWFHRFCSRSCMSKFAQIRTKEEQEKINIKISKTKKSRHYIPVNKGKTYEELVGFERAKELKQLHKEKTHTSQANRNRLATLKANRIIYLKNNLNSLGGALLKHIFKILDLPCSRCGWNEAFNDMHHINGKRINLSEIQNLTWLCPNCNRLAQIGKIKHNELIPIIKCLPLGWAEEYCNRFRFKL